MTTPRQEGNLGGRFQAALVNTPEWQAVRRHEAGAAAAAGEVQARIGGTDIVDFQRTNSGTGYTEEWTAPKHFGSAITVSVTAEGGYSQRVTVGEWRRGGEHVPYVRFRTSYNGEVLREGYNTPDAWSAAEQVLDRLVSEPKPPGL